MYRPVLPLWFSEKGPPPSGDYRVCEVSDETGRMIACITQHVGGRRTYEFDNDVLYPHEVVGEIMSYPVPLGP